MVWIGFRSWKYALIALIPNAVPIYMVMGLLGLAGPENEHGSGDDRGRLDGHVGR